MIIAFEGPDNTGKSTSASNIGHLVGEEAYNMTKENHSKVSQLMQQERGLVHAFDRIDWLTHMAYRLALPAYEWNDARVRTVFAAPDTHLVFKLHSAGHAENVQDELYDDGKLTSVNDMYHHLSAMISGLNEVRGWSLFKTVTIMEVEHVPEDNLFRQRVVDFSSPVNPWGSVAQRLVKDDETLLELLHYEDQRRV